MADKFAIKKKGKEKWYSLDYHDGSEIILVDEYENALHFEDEEDAQIFLEEHDIDKNECVLYILILIAQSRQWRKLN